MIATHYQLIWRAQLDFCLQGNPNCAIEHPKGLHAPRGRLFMKRNAIVCFTVLLISGTALLLTLDGCGNYTVTPLSLGKIQHIVVVIQENRTPDNLFHDPVLIARGADIASSGLSSSGAIIPLTPAPLGVTYDLDHSHSAFLEMYQGGKMNGADRVRVYCDAAPCQVAPPPHAQFKYVQPSDVAPYFQMAEQYTFADRMFQTNQGPSLPAHQFLFSGTSAPTPTSSLFVAENTNFGLTGACNVPAWVTVALIGPDGKESSSMYPCFEHPTLADELDAAKISWRYYAPDASSI
jgi:phospholipase C